jgi:tetratricopeptide (TPR) repeat protein
MNKNAKEIMEEGWKARENLEFERAEKLLNEAMILFEEAGDWFNVTEALNHLAYTEKLRAVHHNLKGMEIAKKSKEISEKHGTKKALILRTLMSLADSAGLYEQALKWGHACLVEFPKPLPKADILSHVATFQLRTGNLFEAEKSINEAEDLMKSGWDQEFEPHRSIWKSKILVTKGLILYNKNDLDEARKYLTEALSIAERNNLKTRVPEIKEIMNLF